MKRPDTVMGSKGQNYLKKKQKNRTKKHQDVICPFHCVDIWTNGAKAMVVWKGFIIFLAPIKVAGTELP